jgi:hypothetical protein
MLVTVAVFAHLMKATPAKTIGPAAITAAAAAA